MRDRWAKLLQGLALVAALLSALAFCGALGWQLDLLAHFRLQALAGAIALLIGGALLRSRLGSAVAVVAVALNAYALLAVPVTQQADAARPTLTVVAFNLLGNDRRIDDVVAWLRQGQFDVVSFEELTPSFATQLDAVADIYPYRLMAPRKGGFGIGIVSRHPFATQETLFADSPLRRVLRVGIQFDGAPVEIVVLHPPPPLGAALAREHDEILDAVARLPPDPRRIVMGDFNAAPTSLALRRLMATLALAEASVLPRLSWSSEHPWPLRIPIDHVLVGTGLALVKVENGPALGSDHFPQIARVAAGKSD